MGKESVIVDMIGYDKDGHSVYTQLGNGTETTYAYDRERRDYNHAGECVVKSHGDMEGVYINGVPQGITFHENDEFTLYPASIISVNKNRFTKHYFIGSQRVASRIGSGIFNNVYGRNGSYITAGQQDYAERLNQIEQQRENYYRDLGIAPGVPTMKGAYGDPENTGVGYNTIITELGDHSVPKNWEQFVVKRAPGETPGPPIIWGEPQSPEEVEPGYGFIPDETTDEETFFYHSDHLGSTSYITDDKGNITQYDAYLPYGELLIDEHSSSEEMPYKFNGKELDEETGLYYYGARYMQPVASVWYGVDQLTEEYASVSGYTYCFGNPIKLVDTDGKKVYQGKIQVIYLQNGKLTLSSKASEYTKMLYNGMMKTKTGRKQLLLMVKSPTAIHLEYSSKDTNTKNSVTYADTQQAKQDGSSIVFKNGKYSSTWAKITFYIDMIKQSMTEVNNDNYNLSMEEALAAEATHESVHAADPDEVHRDIKSSQPNQKTIPPSTYEKKARETESMYRKELKEIKEQNNEK